MKNNGRVSAIVSWLAVAAWAACIFWLSSRTPGQLAEFGPWFIRLIHFDKVAHAGAFSLGALLLANALQISIPARLPAIALLAVLGISLFGATDEWHQLYTPGRSGADVGDWLADTLGAVIGAYVFFKFHGRFPFAKTSLTS